MRVSRIIPMMLLLLTLPLLPACGFKDIDKRFFLVAMGLDLPEDKESNKLKISFKLAIPKGDPKHGEEKFQVLVEEARTISEGLAQVRAKLDKELELGHLKAIVFGEALAKKGLDRQIDWIVRRPDLQVISWLAVGRPTAEAVMRTAPPSERYPSNTLFLAFGNTGAESKRIVSAHLFSFARDIREPGVNAMLPLVQAAVDHLNIERAAVFQDKDVKLSLVLNPEETKLINFTIKKDSEMYLQVESEEGHISVQGQRTKVSYQVLDDGEGGLRIPIQYTLNGLIEEAIGVGTITNDKLQEIERQVEAELVKQLMPVLVKLQKQKLDPLGFGLRYRATRWESFEKETKDWLKLYPEARFEVSAKCDLESTGYVK